jgi:hypothetical protein
MIPDQGLFASGEGAGQTRNTARRARPVRRNDLPDSAFPIWTRQWLSFCEDAILLLDGIE